MKTVLVASGTVLANGTLSEPRFVDISAIRDLPFSVVDRVARACGLTIDLLTKEKP